MNRILISSPEVEMSGCFDSYREGKSTNQQHNLQRLQHQMRDSPCTTGSLLGVDINVTAKASSTLQ